MYHKRKFQALCSWSRFRFQRMRSTQALKKASYCTLMFSRDVYKSCTADQLWIVCIVTISNLEALLTFYSLSADGEAFVLAEVKTLL